MGCDEGGTTPPTLVVHSGDAGDGRWLQDGHTIYRNVGIHDNVFLGPGPEELGVEAWQGSFLHVGAVKGLQIQNNTIRKQADGAAPDLVLYSNPGASTPQQL